MYVRAYFLWTHGPSGCQAFCDAVSQHLVVGLEIHLLVDLIVVDLLLF